MKKYLRTIKVILLSLPVILLSACSECPVDLTAQRCANIIEAGKICQLYSDGKISSKEAAEKLDDLCEDYKDLTNKLEKALTKYQQDPEKLKALHAEIASYDQSTEAKLYKEQMLRSMECITKIAKGLHDDSVPDQDIIAAVERYNAETKIYYL